MIGLIKRSKKVVFNSLQFSCTEKIRYIGKNHRVRKRASFLFFWNIQKSPMNIKVDAITPKALIIVNGSVIKVGNAKYGVRIIFSYNGKLNIPLK